MTPGHKPFDETFRKTFRDLVLWRRANEVSNWSSPAIA